MSASDCWAVGDYGTGGPHGVDTVIEQFNGSAWVLVPGANTAGSYNTLNSVTCISATDCWAVGESDEYGYGGPGPDESLIEQYNGTVWSIVPSPNAGQYDNTLFGVTCSSASTCWAVGWEEGSAPQSLIEEYSGGSWSLVNSPDPGEVNWLYGVTCVSASDCWAVGQYATPPSHIDTELIVQWNGSSWSSVSGANAPGGPQLNSVTCVSTTDCWAVGEADTGTTLLPLVEQYNGASWSVVASPNPGGTYNYLNDIKCLSASNCWAVGYWLGSPGDNTLIEQYNGTAWAIVSSPSPAWDNLLFGVVCLATTDCWAAGFDDTPNLDQTLLEQYNGSTWSVVGSPNQNGDPVGGAVMAPELYGGNNCSCANADLGQAYDVDPVDTAYGNLTETSTDVSIPGRGVPLEFTRTYNSLVATSTTTSGPLGYGWTFNGLMSLSQTGGTGPVTITQEGGAQVVFNQTGSTYAPALPRVIATLTLSAGVWTFVRDAADTYTFSSTGQLTSAKDLNGYTTTYAYNGSGQLTTITDSESRTLTIGWTGTHITTVTDPNVTPNRTVSFQYNDGNGNLTDVIDVNGGHTHYVYSGSHQLINLYDPNCYTAGSACNGGHGVVNTYYPAGQVDTQQDQLGRTTTFVYTGNPSTATGGTTLITNAKGNAVLDTYEYGLLVDETKGYGTAAAATWQYFYDPFTVALSGVVDPDGNGTAYTYDTNGNQLDELDSLGRLSSATYNAFNEALTKTDGDGVTTSYTYDTKGNLKSVSTPLIPSSPQQYQVTNYFHADTGHTGDLTSMQDPDGKTWTYTYDAYGNRATVKDPLGDVSTTCYNADGWTTATYTPLAGAITCANPPPTSPYRTLYSYTESGGGTDEFGDVQTVTDPLSHTTKYTYDADRNMLTEQDGDGNTTTYVYDLDNEQTQIKRADIPQTTLITNYNLDGTVNYQEDGKGNKTLTYGYDSLGRITSEQDADNNTTTYTLDGDGNVLTTQLPGGSCPTTACITSTYDADSEFKTVTYSDGVTPNITNITYDSDGRRLTMTDGTGTTTDNWDSLGRLSSEQNGAGTTIGYGYDLKSQLTSITYPGSKTVNYGYDTAGRLKTVQDWLGNTTTYTPNADSFDTGIAYQNGVNVTQTPNDADQNMGITDKLGATTLASMTYARDGNNQVSGETDTGVPQVATPDTYTPLDQIKGAGSASYGYDSADNLTTLTNASTQLFDPADELCWTAATTGTSCTTPPSGATTYTYDTRGDRTKSTTGSASITYGYDEASRLTSYTSATETATYKYDGDGLRMSKTVNGVTTPFTWDSAASTPLLLSDGTTDYIYGVNGTPIEQETVRPAITFVGDTTATGLTGTTTLTVNLPSGTQANDQVFVDTSQAAGTTVSAPSTYTLVASVATGGTAPKGGTSVYRHTVVTGDTSVTLTYGGTASVKAVVLAAYRGVDPTLPVDVFATSQLAGSTTVVAPSVKPLYANERLVVFQGARGTFSSSTWTAPSAMTEQVQANAANVSAGLADQTLSAAGATGTRTSTFGVSANLTTVIVAIPQPPSVLFYQTDQLGSTRLLTDSAGVVRGAFSYDAYGNLNGSTGAYSTPLGWSGQYRDGESGLVYLRARFYDPITAQFMTVDPRLATTRRPYTYAADDPLYETDASGLREVAAGGPDQSEINSYCYELLQEINATARELGVRYRQQQMFLFSGQITPPGELFPGWDPMAYVNHLQEYYQKQASLDRLIQEWNSGPCGSTPLSKGVTQWAYRDDPFIEALGISLSSAQVAGDAVAVATVIQVLSAAEVASEVGAIIDLGAAA